MFGRTGHLHSTKLVPRRLTGQHVMEIFDYKVLFACFVYDHMVVQQPARSGGNESE